MIIIALWLTERRITNLIWELKGLIKISYMLPNPTHLAKSNNQLTFLHYQTLKANHKFKIGCIVSQQEIKLKTS